MTVPSTISSGQVNAPPESRADRLFQDLAPYRVNIDCPDQIRAYLDRFPGLIQHVVPTVDRARREFGDMAELTLTINDDPEAFDPYLKMYVSLPKYGSDTMSRIDQIQEPLDEATANQDGFFLLTTDHRVIGG
jgi:hypothetical protein